MKVALSILLLSVLASATTLPLTSDDDSTYLWIVVAGFVFAFALSFGIGANDVANVFGTSVGAKVLSLRQACVIATFAEILGAILLAGFIVAFLLAFGVGANDVANSFGTSVGSGVLTLRNACILATVFETLGAILIGYKVSDTVRKGILDVSLYNNTEKELMLGSLAALGGSATWNILATFFKLPISGTHAIVGATVGFSLCARGFAGVQWLTFGKIVISWFISPLMSGSMSAVFYMGIRKFILEKEKPLEAGLTALPLFYGFTLLVNVFSVVHDGPQILYMDNLPWWVAVTSSVIVGLLVGIFVHWCVVPRKRSSITKFMETYSQQNDVKFTVDSLDNSQSSTPKECVNLMEKGMQPLDPSAFALLGSEKSEKNMNGHTKNLLPIDTKYPQGISNSNSQVPLVSTNGKVNNFKKSDIDQDTPEIGKLFSFLQVLTATFGSFAHGGNDVSNAIGPLIAIWAIYQDGSVAQTSATPIYILLYGGVGISFGLWIWGRRVIQTIGEDLTKVTPSSGFTIEVGSAFTVLLASKIGLPVSTTHCKVGSVVFVGFTKTSKHGVDWKLFRNIVIAWVVTVPLTAALSAILMLILSAAFL